MKRFSWTVLYLTSGLLACLARGGHSFSGTEGAAFLEIPVGARPAALGSAYSALAEDAYATTWNPAGLAFLDGPQLAGMHMLYLESTSYEYGSYAQPLGPGRGLGLAIQYFRPGAITGRDENAQPIGDINGYYANYAIAYGQALGTTVGVGISGNMIRARIDDVSAHAFAGSAGLLFRPNAQWRLAGIVSNVGQKLTLLSSVDSLPLIYRAGVGYHPVPSWTVAVEGAHRQTGLNSAHVGVEYETPFGFSFRSGYNTERTRELSTMAGYSLGFSMLIWNQDFGYTWLPLSDLGSSHLVSLVWHFGTPEKARSEDAHQLQRPPKEEDMDLNLDEFR